MANRDSRGILVLSKSVNDSASDTLPLYFNPPPLLHTLLNDSEPHSANATLVTGLLEAEKDGIKSIKDARTPSESFIKLMEYHLAMSHALLTLARKFVPDQHLVDARFENDPAYMNLESELTDSIHVMSKIATDISRSRSDNPIAQILSKHRTADADATKQRFMERIDKASSTLDSQLDMLHKLMIIEGSHEEHHPRASPLTLEAIETAMEFIEHAKLHAQDFKTTLEQQLNQDRGPSGSAVRGG